MQTFRLGLFFSSHFVYSDFFDDFVPLQHPNVEVQTSVEKGRTAHLKMITSCCGCNTMRKELLSLRHQVVQGPAAC